MKLNKMELQALASRIYSDLDTAGKKAQENQNKISDKANKSTAETVLVELQSLSSTASKFLSSKITMENILSSMRTTQKKFASIGYGDKDKIYNSLIIAQIDCSDLEVLIEKVKKQFSKI